MDSSDRYKVSDNDAAVWTLIYKLVKAAHGDPFEASRRVAELIAPILDKAEKWDRVKEIAKTTDCYPICPFVDFCANSDIPCCFGVIVDALEGEGEKG